MNGDGTPTRSAADVLFRWRRLVYRLVLAAAVASVGVSLVLPRWYAASSTLVPPQESGTAGSLAKLSSALGLDIGGMGLASNTPSLDLMIGVLKSRRLREQIVDRFDLATVYHARTREHAIKELEDHITVSSTPEGLIEVEVEDRDKVRAAEMANALVELLDEYNRETSVEQARRTSEFIAQYLRENDDRLTEATRKLQAFQEEHGAVELTEQTRATVAALAELEAERTRLEVQKGVLGKYASPDQYKMVEIQARIDEIDSKLAELMGEPGAAPVGETQGVLLPLSRVPGLSFELARLTRDVLVLENVHEILTAEYEQSRIQETKDLRTIQVVDRAVPPIKKARPRRSLIVILTVLLTGIAGAGLAFVCDGVLAREEEWVAAGAAASREIGFLVRWAHRLADWSGLE